MPANNLLISVSLPPSPARSIGSDHTPPYRPPTLHADYPSLFSPKCHLPFSPRIPPTAVQDRMALDSSTSGVSDGIEDETAPRDGNGNGNGRRNGHVLPLHGGGEGYSREFGQAGRESHDGGAAGLNGVEVPLESSGWGRGGAAGPYAEAAAADSKKQSSDSFQVQARQQ